jgi:chaperone required for assembly of F1-ATPase
MKRFYTDVATQAAADGWQVTLDGRALKTVGGAAQIVPTSALAEALAREWAEQGEEIDPARFAMRDLTDYAIDVVAADRVAVAERLTGYGDSDTLLYRADPDEPLYARQLELWEPLVTAFERREQVTLTRVSGIVHRAQSPEALERLRARLDAFDAFVLAGIEAMTTLAASLVVGLSATEDRDGVVADPLVLWRAASLEEEWQADLWGHEDEAEARRARRQADFLRAFEFTRLARQSAEPTA